MNILLQQILIYSVWWSNPMQSMWSRQRNLSFRTTRKVPWQSLSQRVSFSGGIHTVFCWDCPRYVEMLEQQQTQLIIGLQELYRRIEHGQGWLGSSLKESSNGRPLTYDILKRLGALKQDEHSSSETFEEDPSLMQQRLIASGVGSIRRQDSSDCSSDRGHSPIFESIQSKSPILSDHFAVNQFPPTRPNHSSCPRALQTPFQIEAKTYVQPTPMQSDQSWTEPAIGFDDNMDLIRRSSQLNQQTMRMAAANPCLGMPDWNDEDDFKTFGFTLLWPHLPLLFD